MIKNIIKTFFSNTGSIIINFITSIIIARVLGPEGNGYLTSVILIPNTLYILFSGQYFADSLYFIRKKIYSLEEVLASSLIIYFALGVMETIIILGYSIFSPMDNLIYIIIMIFMLNLNFLIMPILIAIEKIGTKNILTVLAAVLNICQVLLLLLIFKGNLNVEQVIITQLVTFVITNLLGAYAILKNINTKLNFQLKKNISIIKTIFHFTKSCYISNLANYLNFRLDQWFIMAINGVYSLGIYSVAVNLSEKFWIIPDSISTILYPEVASSNDHKKIIKGINKTICISIGLGVLGWVMALILLDPIILFLYSDKYLAVSKLIKILFPGIVLFAIVKIITSFFSGIGKPELRVKGAIVGTLVNLLLNIPLIPAYGINGAAFATLISYTIYGIWIIITYHKVVKEYTKI
ncbi:O-antigen/teichoic acid export membrane protein [Clostridium punense]|uniref:O-antigen/teichoic acid export membrane protein n=1 Tax=Clostridium punense TaxID=1054297 RepID=A0ABS4K084_9CLOT|nr:polysaccharide biosynthesis C-terminal domain-containing protein [Clostridium punense]MBP2021183.1 O-antigen/teichoic acid export membrane protein [Clostridium punense]